MPSTSVERFFKNFYLETALSIFMRLGHLTDIGFNLLPCLQIFTVLFLWCFTWLSQARKLQTIYFNIGQISCSLPSTGLFVLLWPWEKGNISIHQIEIWWSHLVITFSRKKCNLYHIIEKHVPPKYFTSLWCPIYWSKHYKLIVQL